MADISNKTLAILISLAIVISLAGLVLSPGSQQKITGMATNTTTETGSAFIELSCITSLTLNNRSMDFGVGYINSSANYCILESNNSEKQGGCGAFNTFPLENSSFWLINDGTSNLTLTVNSTYYDEATGWAAAAFLCNRSVVSANCTVGAGSIPGDQVEYNFTAGEEGDACLGTLTENWQPLNASQQDICTNFDFDVSNNEIYVPIRIKLPKDPITGVQLADTLTFVGTSDTC